MIGQPVAAEALARALVGDTLRDKERPIGVFLFLGPTGVGKTEMAKQLAEQLHGSKADADAEAHRAYLRDVELVKAHNSRIVDEKEKKALPEEKASLYPFIRIDCSEYSAGHTTARFGGAPPGYVGYSDGGQIRKEVVEQERSIILLDEVEKASPEFHKQLLQVFSNGELTLGNM